MCIITEKFDPVSGTTWPVERSDHLASNALNDYQVCRLLIEIDEVGIVTVDEKKMLNKVTGINWNYFNVDKLPSSIELLTSLTKLDLSNTKVSDISALSNLTSLTELDLSNTKVSDISALTNLTSLSRLNLNYTKVSDISALTSLTSLTHLSLNYTKVSDISALANLISLLTLELSNTGVSDISMLLKLTSLSTLKLSDTLVSDISTLTKLTSLTSLDLRWTGISEISSLANLTFLSTLDLSYTGISDISALSKLTALSSLSLRYTEVSDISALSGLNNLETLNLSGIEIYDLSALMELTALKSLDLQHSKTTKIPKSLLDLNLSFITEKTANTYSSAGGIYIYGLDLTDQPIEIFSQRRDLIHAYYREGDQVPVNECKVIFLGDAESGKTHSIRRLLKNGEFLKDFNGESTPGIEITVNPTKLANTDIVINYWDFGGQEIQHSMHRVFLTERTVYVVFLNARQDDLMDERARYWMENIKTFAPDAPVLVVINKIDQNEHPRFNEKGFIDSYGEQVKKIIRLSAKTDEKQVFLDKLQGNINSIIMDLPTVSKKIPRSWKNLMENVREMTDHYLTTDQFIERCHINRIRNYEEIHDELVDLFQVIGVSFCYYQNRSVADYMLLNPKWMLNALYTIVTNGKAVAQNGVITQDNLYDLLEKDDINGITVRRVVPKLRYKGFEVNYILGVIRMFGLSYSLQDDSEFFPMLCDGDEKISVKDVVPENALHFIFRYIYLPTNVMHRLIVEMQRDLDYQNVWYTGAVFRNTQQNQTAYIHSKGNDLHIYVYGEDAYYNPNEYLTPISNIVRNINKDMGISATEFLTCRKDRAEAEIPLKRVKGNILHGIYTEYNETLEEIIDYKVLSRRYFDNSPQSGSLLKSVVYALQGMQRDKTYYESDENSRNRFVSANLNAQLKDTNLRCFDQLPGGTSPKGKAPGERDIVIKNENEQEVLIYEGLNLKGFNKTRIDEHIDKLLGNYNPQGQSYNTLVVYLECGPDSFKRIVDEYKEHIADHAPESFSCKGKPNDVSITGKYIRCIKMQYDAGGVYFTIYHIIVRLGQ